MKCSLKDGFINILLIVFITPSKGIEYPLLLSRNTVVDKPMNLQQFRASINRLQDLDSFPGNGENQLHRIVKKQMATGDYKDAGKSKRSAALERSVRNGAGYGASAKHKDDERTENAAENPDFPKTRSADKGSFLKKLKDFAREKDILFMARAKKNDPPNKLAGKEEKNAAELMRKDPGDVECSRETQRLNERMGKILEGCRRLQDAEELEKAEMEEKRKQEEKAEKENSCLARAYTKIPDVTDFRCYYECETRPNGCLKLRHKHCPKGQFFSYKYLKCMKAPDSKSRRKKSLEGKPGKKMESRLSSSQDDQEPSNEWLDATQSSGQRIPAEFKPKKKPVLKIYHLRSKRKLNGYLQTEFTENHCSRMGSAHFGNRRAVAYEHHGFLKTNIPRQHSRSFAVRVKKKKDKDTARITDEDETENDNDEDDEETEEEDDDEEGEDEDEEAEEEEDADPNESVTEKPAGKDTLRSLLRSAKEAVTNRARFEDPMEIAARAAAVQKTDPGWKSKKSNDSVTDDKKVLIDANIKVDSTISSVLKSFLKNKRKEKEANAAAANLKEGRVPEGRHRQEEDNDNNDNGGDDGDDDDETARMYENLMQNNPRVKRYYLVNCGADRRN